MQWHQGSIPEAINLAKEKQAVFIVFIAGEDGDSRQMDKSLETVFTASNFSKNYVALKLEANGETSKQFSQIYPVVIIPSTYFIGLNGVPLEVIGGQLDGDALINKINTAFEMHEKNKSPQTLPNTSDQSASDLVASPELPALAEANDMPNAAVPIEERVERVKQIVAQRREQKQLEEEEKEKQREIERRNIGKAVQKQRARQQEEEAKQVASEIAKERAEEKAAREKVREQIARDRAERAAKYSAEKAEETERMHEAKRIKLQEEQAKLAADAAIRSQFARLQFRLPDGSSATFQFEADSPLQAVFDYVKETIKPAFGAFSLVQSFPRREFTRSDHSQSLRDLQLTPSAAVLVLPAQLSVASSRDSASLVNFLWLILSPLLTLWRMLNTFVFGRAEHYPPPSQPPSNRDGQRPSTSSFDASNLQRNQPRTGPSVPRNFARQDGNIHRIADDSDDDNEDNNTWNGNSTQQM